MIDEDSSGSTTMRNERHLSKLIYKTLPALLILFVIQTTLMPEIARAQNLSASQTQTGEQDFFGERYREGRDLLDRQEWAKGAEKFREAIEKSPDHKVADAALYWLAFCYKKQKKYKEADAALNRLLEKFPASAWTSDAKVMKLEIAPLIGRRGVLGNAAITSSVTSGQFSSDLQASIVKGTVNGPVQNPTLADKLAMNDRLPLDRTDEIRIAAFQSLLAADPRRAIETLGEILKSDSTARENLKLSILRVWRSPRSFAPLPPATANAARNSGANELAFLLRETLAKSFENEKNLKVRIEIIYRLASFADAESLEYLKRFYAAENERNIKKEIINSLGVTASVFETFKPAQKQSADVYSEREEVPKARFDFLLEILRTERDADLKRQVLEALRRFQERSLDAAAIDAFARAYDSETDENFKISLVRIFANARQTGATKKLLDIVKNDKSDKLRLEAIYALRNSKDPEVLKFLENLIK